MSACLRVVGRQFCLACFLIAASRAQATSYCEAVASDLPVAYWRFSDASSQDGATASDSMGTVTGTYQGGVSLVDAGIGGRAARFNGSAAGIDLGYGLRSLLNGSPAISVEAWVRNDTAPTSADNRQWIFATRIDGAFAGVDFGLAYDSGVAPPKESFLRMAGRSVYPADGYQKENSAWTSTGQWHHVVSVNDYANSQIRIFVDGTKVLEKTVSFNSKAYITGLTQSERDQIGRGGGGAAGYFKGLLDEVAVYNYGLDSTRVAAHYNAGVPADPPELKPPCVSQVAYSPASSGIYLGSPAMIILTNGDYLVSYDLFGPQAPSNTNGMFNVSVVARSTDRGQTWTGHNQDTGFFWSSFFYASNTLYRMGASARFESIVIAASTDNGHSWSTPVTLLTGCAGGTAPNYTTAPVPVAFANGRVYRAFENMDPLVWASGMRALIMSAPSGSDLLNPANWTASNELPFDTAWFNGVSGIHTPSKYGYLEGNAVVGPDGRVWDILASNRQSSYDKAVILSVSADGKRVAFERYIDLPGGGSKFTIRRDPVTGLYLTMGNNITDRDYVDQRNVLSLSASSDLVNWTRVLTLITDNQTISWEESVAKTGFQYADWQIEGDDIIYLVRMAYDGAANYHDSNRITFHRLKNYVHILNTTFTNGTTIKLH